MRKYNRSDNVPLLVETNDNDPAYRRDGLTVHLNRDSNNRIHTRLSTGMLKLFIALILIFLITISLILMANYKISSKLDKLNERPTTKHYRMLTEKHRITRRPPHTRQTKKDQFLRRFSLTSKHVETTTQTGSTTHKIVHAKINQSEIIHLKGDWMCGTAAISKQVTRELIERDCPTVLNAVNGCCAVHDECYDEQLGQLECDTGFCKCLSSVTLDKAKCNKDHAPWFCEMVKAFGDTYYQNAGLNTTLHTGFIDIFGIEATAEQLNEKKSKVRQKRV